MKFILALIILLSSINLSAGEYEKLYDRISNLNVIESEVYDVTGLFHGVDGVSFAVNSGQLYFMEDVNSKKMFFIIVGDGNATLSISDEASLLNIKNQLEKKSPSFQFSNAMLIADQDFADMVRSSFPPAQMPNAFEAKQIFDEHIDFYLNKKHNLINSILMAAIKDSENGRYFSVNFNAKGDNFTIEYNDYVENELILSKNVETRGNVDSYKRTLVRLNSLSDESKYDHKDSFDQIVVNDIFVELDLRNDDLEALAYAKLDCKLDKSSLKYLEMYISDLLEIDSIKVAGKKIKDFFKPKDLNLISFELPIDTPKNFEIEFWYNGVILKHYNDYVMYNPYWYPSYPTYKKFDYKVDITHPNNYTIVGTGNIEVKEIDEFNDKTTLKSEFPSSSPIFELGVFEEEEIEINNDIKLNIYSSERLDFDEIEEYFSQSFKIYNDLYGEIPRKEFNILIKDYMSRGASVPTGTNPNSGQGQSALRSYTIENFMLFPYSGLDRYPLLSLASNIGSFWFGDYFLNDSYREAWIRAGLVSYNSILLMESFPDLARRLENRQNSIKNDFYMLYNDYEPGPIALAGMISKTNTNLGGYVALKGVKFFHMLRNLSYDFNRMNEEPFMSILRSTYNSGENNYFTEEDFINVLNSHFGVDMSWYVRQWTVLDEVPKIEYATKQSFNGKSYNVELAVKKTEVPPDFIVSIPILVIFEDDTFYKTNLNIKDELSVMNLVPFPKEPKEIIINDKDYQIGDFEKEDWEDLTGKKSE